MLNPEFLQKLSQRLTEIIPSVGPKINPIKADIEKQFYTVLQSSFAKLNIVTREEFDAQLKVLARAEQTIAELEEKISKLEETKT